MAKDKPYYPHGAIGSIDSLGRTLGVIPSLLKDIAGDISRSYVQFTITTKKGKVRTVYEPKYELKRIQKRINSKIFETVEYPGYLQGGIKDQIKPRDYIENSKIHAGSKFLISADIRDFYHSIRVESVMSVFKYFFNFPDEVSDLLTRLVTLDGKVPQGACTSSYVANLVFFNSEYALVSKFRSKGYKYSRLLDDITVSAMTNLDQKKSTEIIDELVKLAAKYKLRLNNKKTKLERSDDLNTAYQVTGVWVGHGQPKLRKTDRRYIRQMVFICEKEYQKNRTSTEYHDLWNRVSGYVSKLTRLQHAQAKLLRQKMGLILPEYDDTMKSKIIYEAGKLLRKPKSTHTRIGVLQNYRKVMHALGILSRTDRSTSRAYRKQLKDKFIDAPTKLEAWL